MKKIFFTLIAVLTLTLTGFSQDVQKVASTEGKAALQKSKVTRVYTYTLPSDITQDHIDKVSKYYASYFSIAFDASNQQAVVTMKEDQEKGELIMGRFLSSCKVQEVKVDDTLLSLDQFMKEYLK